MKTDTAVIAARAELQRDAIQNGGDVVESSCTICGESIWGLVVFDSGELRTAHARGRPAHFYCAGYVRKCNCPEPRHTTEAHILNVLHDLKETAA